MSKKKKKQRATRDAQLYKAAIREGFWRGAEKMAQHILDYWPVSARDEHWRRAYRRSAGYVERLQEWAILSDMLAARDDDNEPDIPEPGYIAADDIALPGHPLRRRADDAALAVSRLVDNYDFDSDPRWEGLDEELLALIPGDEDG
jgi:hypothetical protein